MSEHLTHFFGSEAGRGLPTPLLAALEKLIDEQHLTEATLPAQVPALSAQLQQLHAAQGGHPFPPGIDAELHAMVLAEGMNYILQLKDGQNIT